MDSPPPPASPAMDEKPYDSILEDEDEGPYSRPRMPLTTGNMADIVNDAVGHATIRFEQLFNDHKLELEAKEVAAEKTLKTRLKKEKKERADERKELVEMIREMALELDDDKEPEVEEPIVLKDAVGRKFIFPYESCRTWRSFSDLTTQAFTHVDTLGPHVAEGYYDILSPKGFVILPSVWDDIVEPGWEVSMHMWPMAEAWAPAPPPPPPPPPATAREFVVERERWDEGDEGFRVYKRCDGRREVKKVGRRVVDEEDEMLRYKTMAPSLESSRLSVGESIGDSVTSVVTERNVAKEALAEEEKAGDWDMVDD